MTSNFEVAAKRLGLAFSTKYRVLGVPFVHGELEGQKVRCRWGDRATTVEALLDPALDLGLEIHSRVFITLPALGQRVILGDSNWDDEVKATADDAARAAVLFSGDARRAVLGINATSSGFEVTDDRVATFVLETDPDQLVQAFERVARTASLIAAARTAVPPAAPLEAHAKALRVLARERSLRHEETPLAAWGDLRSVRLEARFVRTGRSDFDLVVRAAPIEGSLGSGLLVKRETAMDRVRTFFGGQDLQTGDGAFDPAFLVQAQEADRAIAALDDDVRALLMDLRGRFEAVTLDEGGLSLRAPAARVQAGEIGSLVEAACAVVERVARASAAVLQGPYR